MSRWTPSQIQTLRRLRSGFLQGTAGKTDYWQSESDLALYDATFAQRIGWKWDAVLGELQLRQFAPRFEAPLIDLGCGSGIAARRVLAHWPGKFPSLTLVDRSPLARNFAAARVREMAPELPVHLSTPAELHCEGAFVLLSHIITELSTEELSRWIPQLQKAAGILWVESATHESSRKLIAQVREIFQSEGSWRIAAPCTHSHACPLLKPENARHWCHHFARVPSEAHQEAEWSALADELGLDLSALPYSFLAMDRETTHTQTQGFSRVLGRARQLKGHHRVLSCSEEGLQEWTLQKRDLPDIFKELRRESALPLYRWKTVGDKILACDRLETEAVPPTAG